MPKATMRPRLCMVVHGPYPLGEPRVVREARFASATLANSLGRCCEPSMSGTVPTYASVQSRPRVHGSLAR